MAASLLLSDAVRAEDAELRQLINNQRARAAQFTGEAPQLAGTEVERQLPYGVNPTMAELSGTRTVVFVSRAMPEQILLTLLEQGAGRDDVVFAFRGWGEGGVDKMFAYADGLYKKLSPKARQTPPNIVVQPGAFAAYDIRYAPAVLHRDSNNKWYLVQGALSIDASIGQIKARRFDRRLSQQWKVTEPDQAEVMKKMAEKHDWAAEAKRAAAAVKQEMQGQIALPYATESQRYRHTPFVAAQADIRHPKTGAVLYRKGTRFNVLALDPAGKRAIVVIDGSSKWQLEFARALLKRKPDVVVLYTHLGRLAESGLQAAPLDAGMQRQLQVKAVPSYYSQYNDYFNVFVVKNR
ncbi:TrbC family F-type conjugative pilus assembly protein [Uruburuella suis]|uniref:TrbC family F-type conjugative pilus assembly protein n=1 Tax=Uruburuella suis TaxID=252130 RepID=UPI00248FC684|nr:TrbC family F-type conjugative pilus assembly protein [Uruburuella suis]